MIASDRTTMAPLFSAISGDAYSVDASALPLKIQRRAKQRITD